MQMSANPAARKTDAHTCPMTAPQPHVGGSIDEGSEDVLVNGLPVARKGDRAPCVPAQNMVHKGSLTVRVNNRQLARQLDPTDHAGGMITHGSGDVVVGSVPAGCEFLDQPYLVSGSEADFDRNRASVTIGPPRSAKHQFPGDEAPQAATVYDVDVAGHHIKLIESAGGPATGTFLPTVDQAAQALGAVPPGQLATIKEVVLSPNPNPNDALWAEEYNIPGFKSAATGGNNGVTHYPLDNALTQNTIDSNTIHEGGHTYSQEIWKNRKHQDAWNEAINSDNQAPSKYAESSPGEDFAESLVMHVLATGTPCEAVARAIYPARFAVFDQLFAPPSMPASKPR